MILYDDKAKGILIEQRFVMMTKQLEQELNQGKERMKDIMEKLSLADDMVKGYTAIH